LPEIFVSDPDRLARFRREAQILASLNHPNIAAIYGLEDNAGVQALVLELIEGPTLEDLVAQGPIAIDQAITIAKQIADAFEAAHESGIVHRDLKPANVKIRSDGVVKVLDFGLAKVLEPAITRPPTVLASESPTLGMPVATRFGVILGTAPYMSPEQAKGAPVDKRADIWAFGCVLYEMLTGGRAFTGADVSDVLGRVLTEEPDWTALPAGSVRRLVRRCLEKEPKRRLRDIGDARLDLLSQQDMDQVEVAIPGWSRGKRGIIWAVAMTMLVSVAIAFALFNVLRGTFEQRVVKLQLAHPPGWEFDSVSVSPDSRNFAFTAVDSSGKSQLWVRPFDSVVARPFSETEGARDPFWSPDGRFIAFFTADKLRRIGVTGGAPQTICTLPEAQGGTRGGSWGRGGVILFANWPFHPAPLYLVSENGGEPRQVTPIEQFTAPPHRWWPSFLPDGRHFLYFALNNVDPDRTGIYLTSLDAMEARLLVRTDTSAAYAHGDHQSGHLLFVREGSLLAQPFDLGRLESTGPAVPIAERAGVNLSAHRSKFSVSETGVLLYGTGVGKGRLRWVDRMGHSADAVASPGVYIDMRLSPDGLRVAAQREDRGKADLFLIDLIRRTDDRFTFEPTYYGAPVWMRDASRLTFFSIRDARWGIWEKASNGTGAESLLFGADNDLVPLDWSPDGRSLVMVELASDTGADLWVLTRGRNGEEPRREPFARTRADESSARFSPDGRWIVYSSNPSGRYEIYVRPFPGADPGPGGTLISTDGGVEPTWPRGGKEIFYVRPDNMLMAVEVKMGATLQVGVPRPLFPIRRMGVRGYDVTSDGNRFLVATPIDESDPSLVTVVMNWSEELKRNPSSR
jgi:eukaryotic-like serine/threonine-protein kinase